MASFMEESLVHLSESSSSKNEDEMIFENPTVTSKKRGKGKLYHFHESFETLELAENSLKKELIWSKVGKKRFLTKTKSHQQFYRCNLVRYRDKKQCRTGCVIISPTNTTKSEVHRTTCSHDHNEKRESISVEARLAIENMFKVISNFSSTFSSSSSNDCPQNFTDLNLSDVTVLTNLISTTSSNFINANLTSPTLNSSSLNLVNKDVENDNDNEETDGEEEEVVSQTVKSTGVLPQKRGRGRPADSPGTKLRKATNNALIKKPVAEKARK